MDKKLLVLNDAEIITKFCIHLFVAVSVIQQRDYVNVLCIPTRILLIFALLGHWRKDPEIYWAPRRNKYEPSPLLFR
jgi:hypothetical protein